MRPDASPYTPLLTAVLAAAVALAVVHGLGRFAYTPLLPLLVKDGYFTLPAAASVATWNYVGYLIGAMLAIRWHGPQALSRALPAALLLNALGTLAQAFAGDPDVFTALRFFNGITNGVVFVQAPALVLEWLAARNLSRLSGLIYLGVGSGLLLSSALSALSADALEGAHRWWPMALSAIPLAAWSAWRLSALAPAHGAADSSATSPHATRLLDNASLPLFLAYAGAGLGYILPTTFLPVLAREQLAEGHWLRSGAWIVLALGSLAAAWLWNRLGSRLGDRKALLANYLVQALGVAAPLLFPGSVGVLACAVLVGSTYLGTVLLTQRHARNLQPHQGARLSAALIALYGAAQLTGPWLAKLWLARGGSMSDTWWLGLAALLWGAGWTVATPAHRS